jgi:hypothetical protein
MCLNDLLRGLLYSFIYIDDVRTSEETRICASTTCYGDSITLFYIDDVRTSEETRVCASTTCYGDSCLYINSHIVLVVRY